MDASNEPERLVAAFSTHWIKYIAPITIYVILMILTFIIYLLAQLAGNAAPWLAITSFLVGFLLMLSVHHWFFHRAFSEFMMLAIITSRRFVFLRDTILVRDDMHEISLERILAVRAKKRGIIQNILDYGSLWFDTGGTTMENSPIIPQISHPHYKVKIIMKLMRMEQV